jgi:uncharacterized protein (TIGR03437 family)
MMRRTGVAILFTILTGWQAFGQGLVFDNSGNNMLNGTYYFREVIWTLDSSSPDALSLYGTITFSGTGTYTVNATEFDYNQGGTGTGTTTGTYSIGAGGFGFLSSPVYGTGVQIRGMIANGVFIGSATEGGFNDIFVAGLVPSPSPTAGSFSGTYQIAYVNYPSPVDGSFYDANYSLTANGAGAVSVSAMNGFYQEVSQTTGAVTAVPVTQSAASLKYIASNGAMVVTFPTFNSKNPASTALMSGQEYLYFSPDGNFVFGGSPLAPDMFVGVKTGGTPPLMSSSLFYNAGVFGEGGDVLTYYGALSSAGGDVVLHSRIFSAGANGTFDSVTAGTAPTTPGATYSDPFYNYTIGAGGNYRIGFGLANTPGIDIALAAPAFTGSGVYLNPTGVVNAASYAPFTQGLSAGELLVLTGSNLAPNATIGAGDIATTATFPTKLNGVQVLIDGIAAPLYYVSATQIAAIVPFAASQFSFATIQVNNNGSLSKTITEYVVPGTPGVFTNPANGLGYAAALHADYSLITPNSPAQPGENISVYLTGLGQVFPPNSDGAPGSSTSLNNTVNAITASIDDPTTGTGTTAPVLYSGLAPGYAGLYQVDLTIPIGLTAGDNYLEIDVVNSAGNPTSVAEQALISIGGGTSTSVSPVRAEIQNGETYKAGKRGKPRPLQKSIVVKPVQP